MTAQLQSSVHEEEIRRALARLVSGGPEAIWLPKVQPLFELEAVSERVEAGQPREDALRGVLLEAIEELGESQYRSLLEIVLGLVPESAPLSAGERRALAGKKFRGGERPVTAGTIRQHHERRALAELAKRLTSRFGTAALGQPGEQEWIEWHPAVREAWAEQRLAFWRITTSDYVSKEVVEMLPALMWKHRVGTWTVYETFGAFDLLLETWLPAGVWTSVFERALEAALGKRLVRCDAFTVDEFLTHWVWRRDGKGNMRLPSPSVMAESPSDRQLAGLHAGDERQLARYIESDVAARVDVKPGIGILVAITGVQGHSLLSVAERELVKELLLRVIDAAASEVLSQVVLLRGSGFADFVLQGRVPHRAFHRLRETLFEPLDQALRPVGMRTQTSVLAGAMPLMQEQRLDWRAPPEIAPPATDFLRENESPTLEVRSSAFADLLPDDRIGPTWADSKSAMGLMKTVTAMLNGDGGTIVLGACPQSRAEGDLRFTGKRLEGAPMVGEYVVIGIDQEIGASQDSYLRRVDWMCKRFIEPDPRVNLTLRLEQIENRTVLIITVPGPPADWFYFVDDSKGPAFLVRSPSGISQRLDGREADLYKRRFPRF